MSTPTIDVVDGDAYNAAAIDVAQRLTEARAAGIQRTRDADVPVERLFQDRNRAGLGVALEYTRMGERPVSPELAAWAERLGFSLEHLGVTLGTVIHGIDLHPPISDDAIAFVRATLLERKVVFFRGQHLDEHEQVAFGQRFGGLDAFPFAPLGENPFVSRIDHTRTHPGSENSRHTDVTWMERPSLGSIAQVLVLPPNGGDTLFSDSHACYLGLPAAVQEQLQFVNGINDYRNFFPARGAIAVADEVFEWVKERVAFGVSHPILRTHPETGKTALYLNGGFLRHDSLHDARTGEPWDAAESRKMVRLLLQEHARPEYQCRFEWEEGSIAFWDNRAVQHYAASDYWPHTRQLRRVTVSGDMPFYDPTRTTGEPVF
jgi:taurine dioxygenase